MPLSAITIAPTLKLALSDVRKSTTSAISSWKYQSVSQEFSVYIATTPA